MEIRRQSEQLERLYLSPYACFSDSSRGRLFPDKECAVRTVFQRDRDRIIHSKSFRRLKYKTQVFIIPEGDHFRTRLTHTLEVAQIARTIARALRLNEDLTEAIALGHDLGHTPFGHAGEAALNSIMGETGFKHNLQSLRVVDILEGGRGLNLTHEVRDGILNHTGQVQPLTLEGRIVKIADRIAYINHDIDDAIRGGVLTMEQLPAACLDVLGWQHRERINTMVTDLIKTGLSCPGKISMSEPIQQATDELRSFMFRHVYIGSEAKLEENKAINLIRALYNYFLNNQADLPVEHRLRVGETGVKLVIADYIAGMTDRYAIAMFKKLFVPQGFPVV
jgi:dGTPase